VDLGGLAVGVSCGDAVSEGLEPAHLRLRPAAGVVSCPSFPERPAVVTRGAQGLVAGQDIVRQWPEDNVERGRAVLIHGRPFLWIGMMAVPPRAMMALWQRRGEGRPGIDPVDRFSPERAKPRVAGAVGGLGADGLVLRDLLEQVLQDGGCRRRGRV
jgi:hypothetical protein